MHQLSGHKKKKKSEEARKNSDSKHASSIPIHWVYQTQSQSPGKASSFYFSLFFQVERGLTSIDNQQF